MRRSAVFSGRVTPKVPIIGDCPASARGTMKKAQEVASR